MVVMVVQLLRSISRVHLLHSTAHNTGRGGGHIIIIIIIIIQLTVFVPSPTTHTHTHTRLLLFLLLLLATGCPGIPLAHGVTGHAAHCTFSSKGGLGSADKSLRDR